MNDILGLGGKIGQRYTSALKGFSASIPAHIMSALSTNPNIDYIEEDGEGNSEIIETWRNSNGKKRVGPSPDEIGAKPASVVDNTLILSSLSIIVFSSL